MDIEQVAKKIAERAPEAIDWIGHDFDFEIAERIIAAELQAVRDDLVDGWMKDELADYSMVLDHCTRTYAYFSGGRISKPNTLPEEVFAVAEDLQQQDIAEAIKEHAAELRAELESQPCPACTVHGQVEPTGGGIADDTAAVQAILDKQPTPAPATEVDLAAIEAWLARAKVSPGAIDHLIEIDIPALLAEVRRLTAEKERIREPRKPYSKECTDAIDAIEDRFEDEHVELVSIEHHAKWVDRCEQLEAELAALRAEQAEWQQSGITEVDYHRVRADRDRLQGEVEKLRSTPVPEGSWQWARQQVQAGKLVTRRDKNRWDLLGISQRTGHYVVFHPWPDGCAESAPWIFTDTDFDTDWQLAAPEGEGGGDE